MPGHNMNAMPDPELDAQCAVRISRRSQHSVVLPLDLFRMGRSSLLDANDVQIMLHELHFQHRYLAAHANATHLRIGPVLL